MRRGEIEERGLLRRRMQRAGPAGERLRGAGDQRVGGQRRQREIVDHVRFVGAVAEV